MATQVNGPEVTLTAGEALTAFDCVRLYGATTVTKTGGVASEDNTFIGVAQHAAASGAEVTVRLFGMGSLKCRAAAAFLAGAKLYTMTDGEVDDATTSLTVVGVAMEAATAANDIIEVMPIRGGNDDIS